MDEAEKKRVRDALVEQLEAERASAAQDEVTDAQAADLDQNEAHAVDDLSQSDEAGEMHGHFDAVRDAESATIDAVRALDMSPKTTVEPGAIVEIDGARYLVGVPASPFECAGATYEGMSADSPMFAAARGSKAGESFTFREQEHRVGSVA